jgi:hypothetical protein
MTKSGTSWNPRQVCSTMTKPELHHWNYFSCDEGTFVAEPFLLPRRGLKTTPDVRIHVSPLTPSTLLGAMPVARFADRWTRGGLPEGHVSTGQEPPSPATCRFSACPLVTKVFGHLSPQGCNTWPLLTRPRGTKQCCHALPPGFDTCRWHPYPHGPTEFHCGRTV